MKRYRKMTTDQLDELLQAELRKETPDEEVVLPILEILEEREQKPHRKNRWIISAAAMVAAFALLITALPKTVGANSFWDAVLHVTDSILQFLAPGDSPDPTEAEYAFETNNPGLQQMYDQIVAFGITDPVVPMWLPDGYELAERKSYLFEEYEKLLFVYRCDSSSIVIMYIISNDFSTTQYERKLEQVEIYEKGRIGHAITKNIDNWSIAWINNNVECLLTADVKIEDIYKIIDSIYWRN